jgi:polyadenylate-binding protein 2
MSAIEEVEYPDASTGDEVDDAALEAMKARVAEMEAEAAKLREMQEQANNGMGSGDASGSTAMAGLTEEEKEEVDARSVYVGNVSLYRCTGAVE